MTKRVTMRHLVKQQEIVTRSIPDFRLEFRFGLVRARGWDKILSEWHTNREMDSWIEGFFRAFDHFIFK
jgi:hypothetical protein